MSPIRFIRRLLLAAEEAVNASVDRALGEEVPLDVLLTEDDVEDDANAPDAMRAREQETAELEDLLALPAFERGQA